MLFEICNMVSIMNKSLRFDFQIHTSPKDPKTLLHCSAPMQRPEKFFIHTMVYIKIGHSYSTISLWTENYQWYREFPERPHKFEISLQILPITLF